jgi:tetratricopeptide (TPR) repeat protein
MRLLVLATYRDTETQANRPLADLLTWLRREPRVERIDLRGLSEAEIVDLMEQLAGHSMEAEGVALASALWEETDGNPFFTRELLRHLSETAAISRRTDGRWVTQPTLDIRSLPASVRDVINYRVRRLGDEAEQILGVAAVVGRSFDIDLVAAAADIYEDHVLGLVEKACTAALVTEVAESPGRFSFNHVLTQHTLYTGLSATRRQRLHRRIAETLEGLYGDEPGDRISELARHWAAAVSTDHGKAVRYAKLAGDSALASLGPDEALRWYSKALELLDSSGTQDEQLRCQLLVDLGVAQRQSGDAAYRETLLEAGRLAADLGEAALVVRAALAVHRGFYASGTQIDHDRVRLIERALEVISPDDSPDRARLLATLASELTFHPDHERRQALANEAVAVARRTNDRAALVDALCIPRLAVHLPGTVDQRLAETAEAVEVACALGDPVVRFWAYHTRRYPLVMAGDIEESDRCLEQVEDFVEQTGQPALLWSLSVYRAARSLHAGDAEEADRLSSVAVKLGQDSGQPDAMNVHGVQMLLIRWHQGRLAELVALLEDMREANPGSQIFAGTLATAYVESDSVPSAQQLLDEASTFGWDLPLDYVWSMAMAYWSHAAAEAGHEPASAALYEQLLPFHNRVGFTANGVTGAVAHYLGRLASVLGRTEEAEAHFAEALALHEKLRGPFFIAQTKLAWGRMLLDADLVRAQTFLADARDLADAYGCRRVGQLARRALSDTGMVDA